MAADLITRMRKRSCKRLILICSAAAVLQNCSPILVLSIFLNWSAHWPAAVGLAAMQVGFGLYFGRRSMDDFFWRNEGWPARAAIPILLVMATFAMLRNDANFPVWTAYKVAMHVCAETP